MNFTLANKKFANIVFMVITISLLWFGTFGLMYHVDEMRQDSQMGGCLFDGQSEICTMNFSEHLSSWQSAFTSLPPNTMLLSLLALATFLLSIMAFWRDPLFEFYERSVYRWKLYIKQNPQINFFDSLREAFSQGILNPKIYNIATM